VVKMSRSIVQAACRNICARPSRIVGYIGVQPRSFFALAFESGIRIEVSRAVYGATSRGSHAGTLIGAGAPVYSAIASAISVRLTARSSTMS
jgi:hypothetical protein